MRYAIFALGILAASPAIAGGFNLPGTQHHGRAFWLNDQSWHDQQANSQRTPKAKFTTTYLDGIASRFSGAGGGHGEGAPAVLG